MKKPRRMRRILKWTGMGICILIVAGWAVSAFWIVGYASDRWCAGLGDGFVSLGYYGGSVGYVEGWLTDEASEGLGFSWPTLERFAGGGPAASIPFWLLFLVMTVATVTLFYLDRRCIPTGCCKKCGYNLKGNASGICPECGTKTAVY